jgi:hypothetical protein
MERNYGRVKKCNLIRRNGEDMCENGLFEEHVIFRHKGNEMRGSCFPAQKTKKMPHFYDPRFIRGKVKWWWEKTSISLLKRVNLLLQFELPPTKPNFE